jgi:quercetin dioxygenase-like cupin family protein
MDKLIEKLADNRVPIYEDDRGWVRVFGKYSVTDLHVVSMRPGAVRGNHSHPLAEVIGVIDGGAICEIEVTEGASGKTELIEVEDDQEAYKISPGIKHTVYNRGSRTFYLVCFLVDK